MLKSVFGISSKAKNLLVFVQVVDGDVTGRDFVLRPAQVTMELAGRVITSDAHLSSMKVILYREDRPETPVQTLQLQQASMFYLQGVPIDNTVCCGKKVSPNYDSFMLSLLQVYVARLDTSLPSSQFERFELPEISFRASSTFKFLTFRFDPKVCSSLV